MKRAWLLVVVVTASCGPPPPLRYQVGGLDVHEDRVFVAVLEHSSTVSDDDVLYIVSCPRDAAGITSSENCWWARAGHPRQSPPSLPPSPAMASPGREQAINAAASYHTCSPSRVSIQSDASLDGVEGYWLIVCGEQRFFQWDRGSSRFVDRTPAQ